MAAQVLGGLTGAILVIGWIANRALGPPPCTGGVFIELRPPLLAPGPYRFEVSAGKGSQGCSFEVPLPLEGPVKTSHCPMVLELETEGRGDTSSIVRLAVGATPERLRFRVRRGAETLYDTDLVPAYGPDSVPREESRRFCGRQALARPRCSTGTSQCLPFRGACDGPEDCPEGKTCCANPEWGKKYGAKLATACLPWRRCLERYARIACHDSSDCPKNMTCANTSWRDDFEPPIVTCQADQP